MQHSIGVKASLSFNIYRPPPPALEQPGHGEWLHPRMLAMPFKRADLKKQVLMMVLGAQFLDNNNHKKVITSAQPKLHLSVKQLTHEASQMRWPSELDDLLYLTLMHPYPSFQCP